MKLAVWTILAALTLATGLLAPMAEAKSVKWTCVILDPMNPSSYYCTGSTRRP